MQESLSDALTIIPNRVFDVSMVNGDAMEIGMFQATVIKNGAGALYVEITRAGDHSAKPEIIAAIPCANENQAWAVADAYNYPDNASNDWREHI
jgi:hypothetical protein